ncbi:hypothetical protein [Streptomyces zagrosensis]|uniref:Uncharacterized protein n=1 Tax=Streptomyces zagrosensis TaxID=1042984 RepID=A0A7W9UYG0_9ACTN|nr:hypothetical protein [Streptomyces zagrosensis]MBB5935627.1 hypothetical protein [Streptomyces zagrosensis]
MNPIVRYGDVITVAAGGATLAAATAASEVAPVWWILWAVSAATVAGARSYRSRLVRQPLACPAKGGG